MLFKGNQKIGWIVRNGKEIGRVYNGRKLVFQSNSYIPYTFTPSDSLYEWVVPRGMKKLHIECVASKGADTGGIGGAGGKVECDLNVEGIKKLYIAVGKIPDTYRYASYNASDIRLTNGSLTDNDSLNSRIVVAGGGGSGSRGAGTYSNGNKEGGLGGGLIGGDGNGEGNGAHYGTGGTQTEGGSSTASDQLPAHPGTFGLGGDGNYRSSGGICYCGAGGAGWYGGGGGSGVAWSAEHSRGYAGSGGGGSSYSNDTYCSNVEHTQGFNAGSGYITISKYIPTLYTLYCFKGSDNKWYYFEDNPLEWNE